jgi:hypothetical protein
MEKWNTKLHVKPKQEVMQTKHVQIRRGIFQRNSLQLLLICIAHIPLTNGLNKADCGHPVYRNER